MSIKEPFDHDLNPEVLSSKDVSSYRLGDNVEVTIKSAQSDFIIKLKADDVVLEQTQDFRELGFPVCKKEALGPPNGKLSLKIKGIIFMEPHNKKGKRNASPKKDRPVKSNTRRPQIIRTPQRFIRKLPKV